MNIKLSALALGITLAYGATAAMAADTATVDQNGNFNSALVEQWDNSNASASVYANGTGNEAWVYQHDTKGVVTASISSSGWANDASVNQEFVNGAAATIVQTASGGGRFVRP